MLSFDKDRVAKAAKGARSALVDERAELLKAWDSQNAFIRGLRTVLADCRPTDYASDRIQTLDRLIFSAKHGSGINIQLTDHEIDLIRKFWDD